MCCLLLFGMEGWDGREGVHVLWTFKKLIRRTTLSSTLLMFQGAVLPGCIPNHVQSIVLMTFSLLQACNNSVQLPGIKPPKVSQLDIINIFLISTSQLEDQYCLDWNSLVTQSKFILLRKSCEDFSRV